MSACASRALPIYSLLISGGLAGLAGAGDVLAVKGLFQGSWNPQYGMTAIPLVFLARLTAGPSSLWLFSFRF